MGALDVSLFKLVNGSPDSWAPFWLFFSEMTKSDFGRALLAIVLLACLAAPGAFGRSSRKAALLALIAWPLADATTNVLKHAWQWNRPSWPEVMARHPEFHCRVEQLTSFGTASAHAANMAAVATCFLWLCRPLGWAWALVALLTGLSRIYVGVHWPSEVALGWLCGAVAGTIVVHSWAALVRLRARRPASQE